MDKYIGFDIDCKKTVACVVENGEKDFYATIEPDVESMKKFLVQQKRRFSACRHFFAQQGRQSGIDSPLKCRRVAIEIASLVSSSAVG